MAWFRGDDKSHSNPKLLAIGTTGRGLYWTAVSWCADYETDGRVPVGVIPSFAPDVTTGARAKLIKAMCTPLAFDKNPLWVPEEEGGKVIAYWIHDYHVYNPSHQELDSKRKTEKERLATRRESQKLRVV